VVLWLRGRIARHCPGRNHGRSSRRWNIQSDAAQPPRNDHRRAHPDDRAYDDWPPTTDPPTYTIRGTFTVDDFQAAADSIARRQGSSETYDRVGWTGAVVKAMDDLMAGKTFSCSSGLGGGYDDIRAGTQVTVTDEGGTLDWDRAAHRRQAQPVRLQVHLQDHRPPRGEVLQDRGQSPRRGDPLV
jgi:hypothetical protein